MIRVSIAAHVIGLLIFGGFVVVQRLQPEPVTFERPVTMKKVEPKKREYKMLIKEQQPRASRPKIQPRLQSQQISQLAIPSIDTKISPIQSELNSIPGISDGIGDVGGFGAGAVAQIFGVDVVANNLGVILDVSFSTHNVIDKAIDEIQKAFPDAILVLAPGCGMNSKYSEEIVSPDAIESDLEKYTLPEKVNFQMTYFLYDTGPTRKPLMETNTNFQRLYRKAKGENRLYVLHQRTFSKVATAVTQEAFKFLMDEGVDGIYWFADFEDAVEEGVKDQIIRTAKRKRVRIYQQLLTKLKNPGNKLDFAKETGGEIIDVKL